jgi:hypothetical protein
MPPEAKPAGPDIKPLEGSDAAPMPHPNLPLGPLPPPFVPLGDVRLPPPQAGVQKLPPGTRSVNLGEMIDRVLDLSARLGKLEDGQVKFFADCRKRLETELLALKLNVSDEVEGLRKNARDLAHNTGAKIDARYAGHFRTVEELDARTTEALLQIGKDHETILGAVEVAARAAGGAKVFATKLDILAGDFTTLKGDVGTRVAGIKAELAKGVEVAKATADEAKKAAGQAAKDVPKLNERVTALEGFRDRQIHGRPSR